MRRSWLLWVALAFVASVVSVAPVASADDPTNCAASQKVTGAVVVHAVCSEPSGQECLLKAKVVAAHADCPKDSNVPTNVHA